MKTCMNISVETPKAAVMAPFGIRHSWVRPGCLFSLSLSKRYQGQETTDNVDRPESSGQSEEIDFEKTLLTEMEAGFFIARKRSTKGITTNFGLGKCEASR